MLDMRLTNFCFWQSGSLDALSPSPVGSDDPFSGPGSVRTAINQFRQSTIGYLLATTYPNARQNTDIKFGQVRHLNLCAPPFDLPPPFEILREDDDPDTGRVIGVWRRSDIE
jgi:hypothetical protein